MTILRLTAADWQSYRALRLRALEDSPDAFAATLEAQLARPDSAWADRLDTAASSPDELPLLAEHAGAPAGLAWAKADAADPAIVELFQVWVAPEARGRGLATALLRAAIGWARERRFRAMTLGVTQGDTPAVRLYRREGFRDIGAPVPLRPGSRLLSQAMRLEL
ncbi:GNAT family N-acetyltransferase [Massilia terrae]|uniref:GNAT family N-acetyltransferase n=1 Tax=Massilia terrae TaxID=1811224 RepID=A0ABT2CV24_9BURK|nr:GNAT family N-acetyltransferase [Massilia terrae]MCS0657050.1 GNAT family N-acetyltransferase [Massilia terrae]